MKRSMLLPTRPHALLALVLLASSASGQLAAHTHKMGCGPARVATLGRASPGTPGFPVLRMAGSPQEGLPFQLEVSAALPLSSGFLLLGSTVEPFFLPAFGATLFPSESLTVLGFGLDAAGASPPLLRQASVSPEMCGHAFVAQAAVLDPAAMGGLALTKALHIGFGQAPGTSVFPGSKRPVGLSPTSVVVADMDVDGSSDHVRVQVLTNAGALTREQQLAVVERLTALVAEHAGRPDLVERTWVLLTEAVPGGWGLWGHAHTNDELVAEARKRLAG